LADEVKPRAIFGDLNESRATTNDLEPHANIFDVIKNGMGTSITKITWYYS